MVTHFTHQTTQVCFWKPDWWQDNALWSFGTYWCYTTAEIVGLRENRSNFYECREV